MYKASELNAMGIYGGKITNIAWQTLYSNSSTSTFYDYAIKMGCTQSNSLSSIWQTGLFTVYQPKTFVVGFGWNQLDFDTAYEWDGVSNLVIEICYDNLNYNGILITYCAKGLIKRILKKVGFKIYSFPGPKGKREITQARKI